MSPNHLLVQLVSIVGTLQLTLILSEAAPVETLAAPTAPLVTHTINPASAAAPTLPKLKRDSRAKVTSLELDSQETGYLPTAYQATDSDYGYDAGKNTYGKQASDWSLYDQGEFLVGSSSSSASMTGTC